MSAFDAVDRLGIRVAERASPIVVKEVRQGLRTRVFWVCFALMLLASLTIALVEAALDPDAATGAGAFAATFSVLGFVEFFVIPFTAFRSMAKERDDETWVLLSLTGLGPRRVIRGKIASFVLQGLLYASAAAPFLLFSYFLNGIDLPTIVVAVAMGAAFHVFLVSVTVSLATVGETRLARGVMQFVVLGLLAGALFFALGVAVSVQRLVENMTFSGSEFADFAFVGVSFLVAMVSTAWLLFEVAAASLSMSTEDYARGVRLAFTTQVLAGLGLFVTAWFLHERDRYFPSGSAVVAFYVFVVGTYVASDADGLARNLAATGRSWLKPGALRGYAWVVATVVVGFGAFVVFASRVTNRGDFMAVTAAAPGFALLYLAAGQVLGRLLPHAPHQRTLMIRVATVALVVVAAGVPPLLGAYFSKPNDTALNMLNPVVGLTNLADGDDHSYSGVVVVWVFAAAAALWAWALARRADVVR